MSLPEMTVTPLRSPFGAAIAGRQRRVFRTTRRFAELKNLKPAVNRQPVFPRGWLEELVRFPTEKTQSNVPKDSSHANVDQQHHEKI